MTPSIVAEFPHFPASKNSIANRKPVYGVGVNDANYITTPRINGKRIICPLYGRWKSMLGRCYSIKYQANKPSYKDCTVAAEWLYFMTFRAWMTNQAWAGMELDKDILIQGNKIYGPDCCAFVDMATNMLLNDHASARGKWPVGVHFHKSSQRFLAKCNVDGKGKYLGLFDTPEEAGSAYLSEKIVQIRRVAALQLDPRVRDALLLRATIYSTS